jgi:allantoate deiminase/N-carbamoyl-L-amino-acid hydrolase
MSAVADRIKRFIDEVAAVGVDPRGGWSRLAFTPEERAAHEVFGKHATALGLDVSTDAVGNSVARAPGGQADILVGSHLDTVPQGGRYDGVAGVAVALEVVRMLQEQDRAEHCGVVAFAAEEGARFGMPCIGSRAAVGALRARELTEIVDRDGETAARAAESVGLAPLSAEPWLRVQPPRAFFEVHIEQGIVLERRERNLGLVDAIAGSTRMLLGFEGRADHSGATPMVLRRDALVAASALVVEVDAAARRHPTSVATVGRLDVRPGSVTTVPGEVELAIDARDIDSERQRELAELLLDDAIRISRRHDVDLTAAVLSDQSPVLLHHTLRRRVADAARELDVPCAVLTSGAMHDAAFMAQVAPAALVFVPSRDGISHSPAETSDAADLARAAEVVARAIMETPQ